MKNSREQKPRERRRAKKRKSVNNPIPNLLTGTVTEDSEFQILLSRSVDLCQFGSKFSAEFDYRLFCSPLPTRQQYSRTWLWQPLAPRKHVVACLPLGSIEYSVSSIRRTHSWTCLVVMALR
ncbi:hypothetical protein I3843_11G160900 [Carya illinoinensis]|nr:hypothetical protein I3843_11G160900 [Carya illinoinensis]